MPQVVRLLNLFGSILEQGCCRAPAPRQRPLKNRHAKNYFPRVGVFNLREAVLSCSSFAEPEWFECALDFALDFALHINSDGCSAPSEKSLPPWDVVSDELVKG
mmetsp:Transcript_94287/g.163684  ORF Transcript_94287/g.163684 Transcript_94287/m.163684 type:complete len:104 (-) Transcript_94287:984-1295(-)